MAKPARNLAIRNLESAANSTVRTTGNIASKATVKIFRWVWTDHSGMGRALSNMPKMGFRDSIKYIFRQFLIAVARAVLVAGLTFLLIAFGIRYYISAIF